MNRFIGCKVAMASQLVFGDMLNHGYPRATNFLIDIIIFSHSNMLVFLKPAELHIRLFLDIQWWDCSISDKELWYGFVGMCWDFNYESMNGVGQVYKEFQPPSKAFWCCLIVGTILRSTDSKKFLFLFGAILLRNFKKPVLKHLFPKPSCLSWNSLTSLQFCGFL